MGRLLAVSFGEDRTGLSPSYQLKDASGANDGSKITTGIVEIGHGFYQADVTLSSTARGILWSSEEVTPLYAYAEVDPYIFPVMGHGGMYQATFAVRFDSDKTGLSTVGYQLKNLDGTSNGTRVTAGIVEVGAGWYQKPFLSLTDSSQLGILWDTGEGTPSYNYDVVNPGDMSRYNGVGIGANLVTITLTETGGTPVIPSAIVKVNDSGDSTLLVQAVTDSNGIVKFMLDNGTYKIHKQKQGSHSFTNPETLTVNGVTTSSYIGTPIIVSGSSVPDTCRMYIWARSGSGALLTSLTGNIRIVTTPYEYSSTFYKGEEVSFTKHADGYWYVDVVYGASINIYIPVLGINVNTTSPSQSTVDISTLL